MGEIVDSHMLLWDFHNNYPWLNDADPNLEKMIGDYASIIGILSTIPNVSPPRIIVFHASFSLN